VKEGCLAKIIYAESRGESIEGAIAVGEATVIDPNVSAKRYVG